MAFSVEYKEKGERCSNIIVRKLLVKFFTNCEAKYYFHRAQFDIKILIFDLFMWRQSGNYKGFVHGMNAFKNFEDTMILVYVCTNNTSQNVLNLKDNTIEFSGNYAINVKDITEHEPEIVLNYNGRDGCNTMYLWDKYIDKMQREEQVKAYEVLKNTVLPLVQADIHGIHINKRKSLTLKKEVKKEIEGIQQSILDLKCVREFRKQKTIKEVWEYNLKAKTKVKKLPAELVEFNPNSGTQVAELLHDFLKVEVIDTTKTGLPSTNAS